jgi:hypothetical protein
MLNWAVLTAGRQLHQLPKLLLSYRRLCLDSRNLRLHVQVPSACLCCCWNCWLRGWWSPRSKVQLLACLCFRVADELRCEIGWFLCSRKPEIFYHWLDNINSGVASHWHRALPLNLNIISLRNDFLDLLCGCNRSLFTGAETTVGAIVRIASWIDERWDSMRGRASRMNKWANGQKSSLPSRRTL